MLILAIILAFATCLLLVLGFYRTTTRYAVTQRIEKVKEEGQETPEEELQKPFAQRVLLPIGETVAKVFRGYTPTEVADRNQRKLVKAGLFPRVTPAQFQGLCWICAGLCLFFVITFVITAGTSKASAIKWDDPVNILYVLIAVLGGFIIPQFVLSKKIVARQQAILSSLPYGIDLLSISVEAGLGFDAAVGYTMRKIKGPLADEFAKTLNEIRLGKPRLEALEDLGNRTGVEELKIFITAVVHASRLGGSITNTLRVQADSIRVRHRQRVQELAMKAPVKMVFPLVFFIFPALFVVILGPALISIWKYMF